MSLREIARQAAQEMIRRFQDLSGPEMESSDLWLSDSDARDIARTLEDAIAEDEEQDEGDTIHKLEILIGMASDYQELGHYFGTLSALLAHQARGFLTVASSHARIKELSVVEALELHRKVYGLMEKHIESLTESTKLFGSVTASLVIPEGDDQDAAEDTPPEGRDSDDGDETGDHLHGPTGEPDAESRGVADAG